MIKINIERSKWTHATILGYYSFRVQVWVLSLTLPAHSMCLSISYCKYPPPPPPPPPDLCALFFLITLLPVQSNIHQDGCKGLKDVCTRVLTHTLTHSLSHTHKSASKLSTSLNDSVNTSVTKPTPTWVWFPRWWGPASHTVWSVWLMEWGSLCGSD